MSKRVLLLAIALHAVSGIARADHPEEDPDGCRGTVGGMYISHSGMAVPVITGGPGVYPLVDPARGPFYVDIRDVASAYWPLKIKIYQETNGVAGLQRWGGSPITPDLPFHESGDRCPEPPRPDSLVF